MLDIFSFIYFVWVILAFGLIFLMWYFLKDTSYKTRYYFLFGLTVFAWVLHFSRYWLDPDLKLYEMFFLDLCGFSTMVYPFFFLSKNKVFKDYMYYVGGVFAAHSLFYPNNIEGNPILYFDTIRFFFAHLILVSVPLLLVFWKMHKPNIKHLHIMFLFVMIGGLYNMALSSAFVFTGMRTTLANYMGLWGNTNSVFRLFEKVAPFMRYSKIVNGVPTRVPIPFFYMIPGLIVFYVPLWVLMSLPFMNLKKTPKS